MFIYRETLFIFIFIHYFFFYFEMIDLMRITHIQEINMGCRVVDRKTEREKNDGRNGNDSCKKTTSKMEFHCVYVCA